MNTGGRLRRFHRTALSPAMCPKRGLDWISQSTWIWLAYSFARQLYFLLVSTTGAIYHECRGKHHMISDAANRLAGVVSNVALQTSAVAAGLRLLSSKSLEQLAVPLQSSINTCDGAS